MSKNTGVQAFPVGDKGHSGMTLRDYFAAKAMQGCMADINSLEKREIEENYNMDPAEFVSNLAYKIADAMLKEREIHN